MVNESIPTSVQWADQQAIWWPNLSDIVTQTTPKADNAVWANAHKGIFDTLIGFIAKLSWNPDPFTWKGGVTSTSQSVPTATVTTPTTTAEFKPENQTTTAPVKTEDGWLFGKFSSTLTNLWNAVESLGEKALGSATNAVNKWLENAGKAWEQAINKAQNVATQTTGNISSTLTDFVKLEDVTGAKNTTDDKPAEVTPGPDYFFPKNNNVTTEVKTNQWNVSTPQ